MAPWRWQRSFTLSSPLFLSSSIPPTNIPTNIHNDESLSPATRRLAVSDDRLCGALCGSVLRPRVNNSISTHIHGSAHDRAHLQGQEKEFQGRIAAQSSRGGPRCARQVLVQKVSACCRSCACVRCLCSFVYVCLLLATRSWLMACWISTTTPASISNLLFASHGCCCYCCCHSLLFCSNNTEVTAPRAK